MATSLRVVNIFGKIGDALIREKKCVGRRKKKGIFFILPRERERERRKKTKERKKGAES